jgi:hypothetical protein
MRFSAPKSKIGQLKSDQTASLKALRHFDADCDELNKIERCLQRFNLFDVLRSSDTEIRHSNVLAWLLDPKESHGLNDLFLRKWLMTVFGEYQRPGAIRLAPLLIQNASFKSVAIRREWQHIDILIEIKTADGEQWAICVENKVHSQQREGQLSDYRKIVEDHYPRPAKHGFVFLTRWQEEPADPIFADANYAQIAGVLKKCLSTGSSDLASEPRLFIKHYVTLLEERFMETSPVGRLARQIYAKHKKALDLILEHRPDSRQELADAVSNLMRKQAETGRIVLLPFDKTVLRFIPKSWDIGSNRDGEDWYHAFCQIGLWKPYPILQAVTGGRTQFAKRVQLVAQKLAFARGKVRSSSAVYH